MKGLAVISIGSREQHLSTPLAMIEVLAPNASSASRAALRVAAAPLLSRASFSSRGMAFSTVCRSARISSVSIVEMSSFGDTLPST